jgi:hypothetical protein
MFCVAILSACLLLLVVQTVLLVVSNRSVICRAELCEKYIPVPIYTQMGEPTNLMF